VLDLAEIRRRLALHSPRTVDPDDVRRAAVSVVLRPGAVEPELLFIERAERLGDPWSGHMAFPGGRVEPGDASTRAAAERETWEEVGLELARAEPLGRLDDLEGHHAGRPAGLVISAFVYQLDAPPPLRPSDEVREALWVPLGTLVDPARHVDYAYPPARGAVYPGIVVGDPRRHVVWGLTYRFLTGLFDALGEPLRHETGRRVVGSVAT
jgi:8-oxo-dGTP pyrophosphatase MutT (NUDIX family)